MIGLPNDSTMFVDMDEQIGIEAREEGLLWNVLAMSDPECDYDYLPAWPRKTADGDIVIDPPEAMVFYYHTYTIQVGVQLCREITDPDEMERVHQGIYLMDALMGRLFYTRTSERR